MRDCLESIFCQPFSDWEAIIVNDGSTDNTEDLAKELLRRESRLKYFYQENQGLSAARNAGMHQAKGEYLLFLDADDWLEPNSLIFFKDAISSCTTADLYRGAYAYWDRPEGLKYHMHTPSGKGLIYPQVTIQNIGPCHSILIRTSLATRLGGFDTALRSCEDWDFWIRAGKMGAKIYSIPEVLVGYRYVPNSMSRNPLLMYEALTEVSRRAGSPDERLPKDAPYNHVVALDYPSIQKWHLIRMLGVMLHQGRVREAAEWYATEKKVWMWEEENSDWKGLASYLSWGYFFDPDQIENLLIQTVPDLTEFFKLLGYSPTQIQSLVKMIFEPQLKRRNHQKFGRCLGAFFNKLSIY